MCGKTTPFLRGSTGRVMVETSATAGSFIAAAVEAVKAPAGCFIPVYPRIY